MGSYGHPHKATKLCQHDSIGRSRISTHSSADDVAEQQSTADRQAANGTSQGREKKEKNWRILVI